MMTRRDFASFRLALIIFASAAAFLLVSLSALAQPESPPLLVSDLDWSRDGSQIAVGYTQWQGQYQQSCGSGSDIPFVAVATRQSSLFPRPNGCSPTSVDFHPKDAQILVGSASTYETWDLVTGKRIEAVGGDIFIQAASWSTDGTKALATSGIYVSIRGRSLINSVGGFMPPRQSAFSILIYSVWSPDGERVASSRDDGRIYLWAADTSAILTLFQGHHAAVKRLSWSPASTLIASVDDKGTILVWNPITGEIVSQLLGHTDMIYDVDWRPDGQQLASASRDNTVRLWDWPSGEMRIVDSSRLFSAVAYSPDGMLLAYGGEIEDVAQPNVEIIEVPAAAVPRESDPG
jgi:WD40 repeat protein